MKKKLSDIGEFGLIRMFRKKCSVTSRGLLSGIGDDAAAFRNRGKVTLVSTDVMLEGIHFDLSYTTFFQLGYKLLAVNVSDIYAMGGIPRYFLISIAVPDHSNARDMSELYDGIMAGARTFGVTVIGGDTSASDFGFMLSGTIIGEAAHPVTRSGARPGDGIFVAGPTGDSAMGLLLLQMLKKRAFTILRDEKRKAASPYLKINGKRFRHGDVLCLIKKHLMPEPKPVQKTRTITAMIDISDGLLMEVGHICEESGVGALIYESRIPVSEELVRAAGALNMDATALSLRGGEDYVLLFTSPSGAGLRNAVRIGEIAGKGRYLVDERGKKRAFQAKGYEHFK